MNLVEHIQHPIDLREGFVAGTQDRAMYALGRQTELFTDIDPLAKQNLDIFCQEVNNGAMPILMFNHQSFVDPVLLAPFVRYIIKNTSLEKFKLPVAKTLADGKQGRTAHLLYGLFNTALRTSGIETEEIIREKDKKANEYSKEEIQNNPTATLEHKNGDRVGYLLAPEGTMDGGRWQKEDPSKVKGIQEITDSRIHALVARRIQEGKPTVIMSIAIDGSFRLMDPNTKKPGKGAWTDMLRSDKKYKVHLTTTEPITNKSILQKLSSFGVSTLFEARTFLRKNPREFWKMTLGELAKHLPEDQQGVWGNST